MQAFVKPEGQTLRDAHPRAAEGRSWTSKFPRRERNIVDLARIDQALRDAATVCAGRQSRALRRRHAAARTRASCRRRCRSNRIARSRPTTSALAHVTGPPLPPDTTIFWEQGILDVLFEYPIQSDRSYFSIHAAFDRLALTVDHRASLPAAGRGRARLRARRRCRAGEARSALAPGGRRASSCLGFLHILDGTDHLLFLLLPRHPVPPLPHAHPDRHRVHRRALDHADRVGLQARAGGAVVSAADRDADRDVDRLHGAREHRGARAGRALDHHLRCSASCTGSASRSASSTRCSSPARTC